MTTKRQTEFKKLYGPWAVVTGASSGIGREFARELASLGLDLVLVARTKESLDTLASELAEQYGIEQLVVSLDLAQPSATEQLNKLTSQLDVGLLVASAGFGLAGLFVEQDLKRHCQMVDLNCRALMEQTHSFSKRMKTRKQSGMILLSSIVGFQGMPYSANYAATKAYVQVLAESLKVELASDGIKVLAVAPGPVATKFGERAGMELVSELDPIVVAKTALKKLGRRTTILPGFMSKLLGLPIRMLPRAIRISIMGNVGKGMVAKPQVTSAN